MNARSCRSNGRWAPLAVVAEDIPQRLVEMLRRILPSEIRPLIIIVVGAGSAGSVLAKRPSWALVRMDSPLEQDGFEPLVPVKRTASFETI